MKNNIIEAAKHIKSIGKLTLTESDLLVCTVKEGTSHGQIEDLVKTVEHLDLPCKAIILTADMKVKQLNKQEVAILFG